MEKKIINYIWMIVSTIIGLLTGIIGMKLKTDKIVSEKQILSDKHLSLFLLMNKWVKIKQENKSISDYLIKKGYHKIAIYGMSFVGETFLEELKDSGIEILYAIDKNSDNICSNLEVVMPNARLTNVDAIIVTAVFNFDDIEKELKKKVKADVISLEDILFDI